MGYMGYAGNRYSQPNDLPPRPRRGGRRFLLSLGLVVISSIYGTLHPEPPYDGSKIVAGRFAWPEGCPHRDFRPGDRLPHSCFDRFQKISPKWARAHHLKVRRSSKSSSRSYYRVGNDAVEDFCIVWEDDCLAGNVYRSVFITDPRILDTTSYGWRTITPPRRDRAS